MTVRSDQIRVLHVDDDAEFADLTATFLQRADDRIRVQTATGAADALDRLEADPDAVDCILSDHDMPGRDGIELLRTVRDQFSDLPFILFTGKGSEAVASRAISEGVTDYLQKETGTEQYEVLANRIANAVQHRRSREELANRNQELRVYERMVNSMQESACVYDEAGRFRMVNQYLAEGHGTTPSELEGEISDLIPRLRAEHENDPYQELLDGERAELRGEMKGEFPRHGYGVIEYRITPLVIDGEIEGAVGVARDITERRQREAELVRLQDLLDETERLAHVGGWEIDAETMELVWTEHLSSLLGLDPETDPSLSQVIETIHEDDRDRVSDAICRALDHGEEFEIEGRVHDGDTLRCVQIHGVPRLSEGAVEAVRGAVRDVTEHRQRERELDQARAEYEELFNGMNDAAWVIDPDGSIVAVNDAAVERTGYSREELLSMRPHDIDAGTENEEITRLIETMPEDGIQIIETVRETKDGEHIPVEIGSSLITYRGQTAILSIGRDITNRKRREQQLEEFASVVSHDLRNPLNVAEGRLELARAQCDSDHLDRVADAHDRMTTLIENLLALARSSDANPDCSPVSLPDLADRSWQLVETADATLETETDRSVWVDPSRAKQLFENLFRNAVEHGSTDALSAGQDRVETDSATDDREPTDLVRGGSGTGRSADTNERDESSVTVTVGDFEDGFYVADDGPGIPAEERDRVFETGYSSSAEGIGFGLSIVAQVAESHDWDVDVTTSERGGARFEFTDVDFAE
jgi:PAS domain S-box-containing protein